MTSLLRNPKDFWTGIFYIAFGAFTIFLAKDYGMGSATRMGPGYFPVVLGTILVAIGCASLIRAFFRPGEAIERFAVKEAAIILGSVLLFGLLLRPAGLIVAMIVLVLGSAAASKQFNWKAALALAIGMTAFSTLVFVQGLGVPMPLLGSWFGS